MDLINLILSYQWILLSFLVIVLLYLWSVKTFDYFEQRKIPYIKPLPFFGSTLDFFTRKRHFNTILEEGYHKFPESRFSGSFQFRDPVYLIHDPELIKQICIKDFDHFIDHANNIDEELDPFMGRNLFFSFGQKWKHIRQALSPAFTGSKMRAMLTLVTKYCQEATDRLVKDFDKTTKEIEVKDLYSRLGNDIIASISFGIEIDSIHDPENDFYVFGKELTRMDGWNALKMFLSDLVPGLMKFFKVRILEKFIADFYLNHISKTIKYYEENKIVRPDMINTLLQARKNELQEEKSEDKYDNAGFATTKTDYLGESHVVLEWSDLDITAQNASFFFGGIETVASLLCFTTYELALNPDVQEKLRIEIQDVIEELDGKSPAYENLQKMKYLDMVVSETLRKWPPLGLTDRQCTKPYTLENYDGTKVLLEKGQIIFLPSRALQHDPKYFPNPEVFDPERFSDENKGKIDQATFLAFGIGPRNCIGSRLALMQAKTILFYILSAFNIEVSTKTDVPLKFDNGSFVMSPKNGFWFNITPIQ